MAYCIQDDIEAMVQLPTLYQLTVDEGDADYIDETNLNASIARADSFIDGYLRGRFTLPLATVPPLIRDLSIQLTIFYLYQRSIVLTMPENVKWNRLDAQKCLIEIQKGKINPFDTTDEPYYTAGATDNDTSVIDTITNYGYKYKI